MAIRVEVVENELGLNEWWFATADQPADKDLLAACNAFSTLANTLRAKLVEATEACARVGAQVLIEGIKEEAAVYLWPVDYEDPAKGAEISVTLVDGVHVIIPVADLLDRVEGRDMIVVAALRSLADKIEAQPEST